MCSLASGRSHFHSTDYLGNSAVTTPTCFDSFAYFLKIFLNTYVAKKEKGNFTYLNCVIGHFVLVEQQR